MFSFWIELLLEGYLDDLNQLFIIKTFKSKHISKKIIKWMSKTKTEGQFNEQRFEISIKINKFIKYWTASKLLFPLFFLLTLKYSLTYSLFSL